MTSRPRALVLLLLSLALPLLSAPAGAAWAPPAPTTNAGTADLTKRLVLVISVDGLTARALQSMGPDQLPHLHRLLEEGAATRNARSQPELTLTLPNHVSMVTGRRIDPSRGGHGVTWNHDRRRARIHGATAGWVESVFNRVHRAGGTTAVYATKDKFSIFDRTWPNAVHTSDIREGADNWASWRARRDLRRHKTTLSILHLGAPDRAGHARGWMSGAYRRALRETDERIGKVLATRDRTWKLRRQLAIVLTSDHGGVPGTRSHEDARNKHNYRVPFAVHARYAASGRNLYSLSPAYQRPRGAWFPATGPQPIRNGDVANLSLDILGLDPVRKSLWNTDQELNWR